MTAWIVDASVAVKWFLTDEPHRTEADLVLESIATEPDRFFVPELFFVEVAATLARRTGNDDAYCRSTLDRLFRLGLRAMPVGHDRLHDSLVFARAARISVYDAIYVSTSIDLSGRWLTADLEAARKVNRAKPGLACGITEFQ